MSTRWRQVSPTVEDGQLALDVAPPVPADRAFTCTCGVEYDHRIATDGRACFRHHSRPYELTDCIDCGCDLLKEWRAQANNFITCDTCLGTGEVPRHGRQRGCFVCDRRGLIHPQRAAWLERDIAAQPDGVRHPYLPTEDAHAPTTAGSDPGR